MSNLILPNEFNADQRTIVGGDDDTLEITHQEDVTGILEWNRKAKSMQGKGIPKNHDNLRHVAHIPMTVLHEWMLEGIISEGGADGWHVLDDRKLRQKLNERDFNGFRTCEGKV